MTPSVPLLLAAPLISALIGPSATGATSTASTPGREFSASAQADVVSHDVVRSRGEGQRVLDYWTPARMASALPMGLLESTGRLLRPVPGTLLRPPRRELAAAAAAPAARSSGARWPAGGAITRTVGRVFLTMDGRDFACSASTVASGNRDLVVTAAHCIKDASGAWASNWTFVPGYRYGEQPYGAYSARRMFVAKQWAKRADDSYDVGFVTLNPVGGRHVADVVGAQRIAFNTKRGQQTYGFGYPTERPYDGEDLVYCSGRPHNDPFKATHDQGMRCDMTSGSSGGPWLANFSSRTGTGIVTSVSSFKYADDLSTMYGPYFGDTVHALYQRAQRS